MVRSEGNNRLVAFLITLGVHAVLLLALILFIIHTPIPPYPESGSPGIEVNFGFQDQGMGDELTFDQAGSEQTLAESPREQPTQPVQKTDASPVATSDAEESIALKSTPEKQHKTPVEKEPQVSNDLQNALSKLKNKTGKTGNDGVTGQPGNQGDPQGTNDTRNYYGTPGTGNEGDGTGTGTSWSLKGRALVQRPPLQGDAQESGIVVVEIDVDKTGMVIKATPGARGSTTTSAMLYAKARQAALKAKFNANQDAPERQTGVMKFTFILE